MHRRNESITPTEKPRKRRWRIVGVVLLILLAGLIGARIALPSFVRWYVNRTINRSPIYDGQIGDVDIHLWRGAYSITDVKLIKTTSTIPVPFFSAKRVDLAIQWNALLHGKLVGQVEMDDPQINFVDAGNDSDSQFGANGPWLGMIRDLFPFQINSTVIHNGSIHFRTYQRNPQVDVYLSQVQASVENLSNVHSDIAPLMATVHATGTAMDQAKFEFQMKLNPTSYHPSFEMAVRLIGLDVTQLNDLSRAYGGINFKSGFFDLVMEMTCRYGQLEGYVKPLFLNLTIFNPLQDAAEDNPLQFFWQAVVGTTTQLLKNQPHDQLATVIPITGDLSKPNEDILALVGNVLRNAFIRAYLPRLEHSTENLNELEFGRGSIVEPPAVDP